MISVFYCRLQDVTYSSRERRKNDVSFYVAVLLLLRVYMMDRRTSIISIIISGCSSSSRLQGASWLLTSSLMLLLTVSNVAVADEDVEECELYTVMILIFRIVYGARLEMLLGLSVKLKFHWDQFSRNFLADLLATSSDHLSGHVEMV